MGTQVGVICETSGYCSIEWVIKDYFSEGSEKELCSPLFCCSDATWFIKFYPFERSDNQSNWISLLLIKAEAEYEEYHKVSISLLGIKKENGSMYNALSGEAEFAILQEWGNHRYIQESELWNLKDELAPDETLKIICTLRVINKTVTRETQTSALEGCGDLAIHFKDLFLSGRRSDVILKAGNQEFKLHKSILSAASPFFEAMFNSNMKENESGVIHLDNSYDDIMKDYLLFLYTGKVEVSPEIVVKLYKIADIYGPIKLQRKCARWISRNMTEDIFYYVLHLAEVYNDMFLYKSARKFFLRNKRSIVRTLEWKNFQRDNFRISSCLDILANMRCVLPSVYRRLRDAIFQI